MSAGIPREFNIDSTKGEADVSRNALFSILSDKRVSSAKSLLSMGERVLISPAIESASTEIALSGSRAKRSSIKSDSLTVSSSDSSLRASITPDISDFLNPAFVRRFSSFSRSFSPREISLRFLPDAIRYCLNLERKSKPLAPSISLRRVLFI